MSVTGFGAPRWAPTKWLLKIDAEIPAGIRLALLSSLYGTLPIYAGGVIFSTAVATLCAWRLPTAPFLLWAAVETVVNSVRLAVLVHDRRVAAHPREQAYKGRTFTDLYLVLTLLWSANMGYGGFIALTSDDWVVATLVSVTLGMMIGGICFRNFGAPRLVSCMIFLSLAPYVAGVIVAREPILAITVLQVPVYLASMTAAAFRLNQMLVSTMRAELDNQHRAHHDPLTGLANRAALQLAFDASPSEAGRAIFYCDLNGFKPINDQFGHAVGDQLLIGVAQRLKALDWPDLFAARVGGDEFVLLVPVPDEAAVTRLREAIIAAVAGDPYPIGNVSVTVGVSVGVAFARRAGDDLNTLMARADRALYAHKSGHASLR
jgi:diguanylate cyclase (GGDEF)-like protein